MADVDDYVDAIKNPICDPGWEIGDRVSVPGYWIGARNREGTVVGVYEDKTFKYAVQPDEFPDVSFFEGSELEPAKYEPLPTVEDLREIVIQLLEHNKKALHPSGGKRDARLIREVCHKLRIDETEYMDNMYLRDPKGWGLE